MILENHSLKSFNTFGLAVNARYFSIVRTIDELKTLLNSEIAKTYPLFILGGGSNLLLTKDLEALVVKIELKGIHIEQEDEEMAILTSGAGEIWHEFVLKSIELDLSGLENLSLIPGCVGASPMQNIGAYGAEIKDTFYYLEALEIESLTIKRFSAEMCHFGYRESVFKNALKGKYIITKVAFKLFKKPQINAQYGAISSELEKLHITQPTPRDISNAVISIRKSKLPDPKEIGNSGSFFKNPVIPFALFQKLQLTYPEIPSYPSGEGFVKVAAGWLIEKAGWKGKTIDDRYGVHKNQALVLVHYKNATGKEIFQLSQAIIDDIKSKFEIELEREVNIL
jgi:UDP-N-acetylmuramate dehydrogenase